MAITRINEFQAAAEKVEPLREFLSSVIGLILDAPGCNSCQLLQHHDDPTRFAIIEIWDSIGSHKASVARIPPGLLQQARALFAEPPRGAYYNPVTR